VRTAVIIPAFNEEGSIGKVIADIPDKDNKLVLVCNNGSTDSTAEVAQKAGATVLTENRKGYGYACLKGIDYLKSLSSAPPTVVFMDGDYSDYPEDMNRLLAEISNGFDLVIGSRALGTHERGAMTIPQRFGNWLSGVMINLMYGQKVTDLGPFRAIKWQKLLELNMQDKTYGWTVEMQAKAIKKGFSYHEIPVDYRKRIGKSKVSGTVKGTLLAGIKIIYTIIKYAK